MEPPAVHVRRRLETSFQLVQEQRMRAMALCNPVLDVEALGFGELPDRTGRLGVLITPWSMNLIHLPVGAALSEGHVGSRTLPVGEVDFVGAAEVGFGAFESCSLFSPVLQFPDQLTARAVANETLGLLLGETTESGDADWSRLPMKEGRAIRASGGPVDIAVDRRRFLRGAWRDGKR
ncbi:[NiFe]-hydrogenase assembly chaperone HybE [Thioalkalivibrio sp.]|uniref:[NiFe]-hydrogenase assembly chaperone HybE n=1 Tax=Thioalkalivibrio sp. TaxID=2093813 RepID=UPI003566C694